jgi:hypothetical protein
VNACAAALFEAGAASVLLHFVDEAERLFGASSSLEEVDQGVSRAGGKAEVALFGGLADDVAEKHLGLFERHRRALALRSFRRASCGSDVWEQGHRG